MEIQKIIDQSSKIRIAVVGDFITDRYIFGEVTRISPEAPVPVLKVTDVRANPGGAGNVVENLSGLGCQVSSFYNDKNIPVKTRVMSGNHHLLRMDEESGPQWMDPDDLDIGLFYGIDNNKFSCVILSDYGKGTVSKKVANKVIKLCTIKNIPVVVDTKSQHDIFFGASIIKSNLGEWHSFLAHHGKFHNASHFIQLMNVENMVITEGANGIWYHDQDYNITNIPGIETDICDPCGAGDTVTAILGMMIAMKYTIHQACELANIAASEVCRHAGVYAIQKADLIRRFNEIKNG